MAIYEPLVYRLARSKGFQDADARNVSQEVLLAVATAVERWEPDPERGRFRTWLFQISRNLMVNFLTRAKHRSLGTGDSGMAELLGQQIDPVNATRQRFARAPDGDSNVPRPRSGLNQIEIWFGTLRSKVARWMSFVNLNAL